MPVLQRIDVRERASRCERRPTGGSCLFSAPPVCAGAKRGLARFFILSRGTVSSGGADAAKTGCSRNHAHIRLGGLCQTNANIGKVIEPICAMVVTIYYTRFSYPSHIDGRAPCKFMILNGILLAGGTRPQGRGTRSQDVSHLFTDPFPYDSVTRRVRLNGQSTSIRLERAFWQIIDRMAKEDGTTTPVFLSKLQSAVLEQYGETRNFTSLLRCACTIFQAGGTSALTDPSSHSGT
jgi:predicted DNA-binding ribbon-helix-helix protein